MMKAESKLHISFLFASGGIGGAERSMSRLMEIIHPDKAICHVIFVGAQNKSFCEVLDTIGVGYYHVPAYSWVKLMRLFRQLETDVAYLFGNWRIIPWALAARFSHVPVIVVAERNVPVGRARLLGRQIDRYFVDGYICNSKAAQIILHDKCRISISKIHVIYNGICQRTYTETRHNVLTQPTLLCVANIQPRKGQFVLLYAASMLKEKYPDLQVNLIGSDYTNGIFFNEAKKQGLQDTYTWLGYVSDVTSFLHRADIFVLPSVEREGTPTSILEAMLVGLPVVASDVGGVSEIVRDGVTGFLVKPGDVIDLAEHLDQLLLSPDMRRQMGSSGREYVMNYHTVEEMVERHLVMFRELYRGNLIK